MWAVSCDYRTQPLSLTQATVHVLVTSLLTFLLCQPLRWQVGVQIQGQRVTLGKGGLLVCPVACGFASLFPINSMGWGKVFETLSP